MNKTTPDIDWEMAFRPRPLLDGLLTLPHLHRLKQRTDLGDDQRVQVVLRQAEVNRRLIPEIALKSLDRLASNARPMSPEEQWPQLETAAIRAAAWLELGQLEEAEAHLADLAPTGGVRALLMGRREHHAGRFDEACALFQEAADVAAASGLPLAAETELEARSFHLRLRLSQRELPEADIEAFEARAAALGAGLTQSLHRVVVHRHQSGEIEGLAEGFFKAAHTAVKTRYTEGHAHLISALRPVPVQVHGALVMFATDPEPYCDAILSLSSLAWRAGYQLEAFEVAAYGVRIGARRFGVQAVAPLKLFIDGLEEAAGPEVWATLTQQARERAARARA